jgi:hypothetical protein
MNVSPSLGLHLDRGFTVYRANCVSRDTVCKTFDRPRFCHDVEGTVIPFLLWNATRRPCGGGLFKGQRGLLDI